jgi:hypothetical protein
MALPIAKPQMAGIDQITQRRNGSLFCPCGVTFDCVGCAAFSKLRPSSLATLSSTAAVVVAVGVSASSSWKCAKLRPLENMEFESKVAPASMLGRENARTFHREPRQRSRNPRFAFGLHPPTPPLDAPLRWVWSLVHPWVGQISLKKGCMWGPTHFTFTVVLLRPLPPASLNRTG